MVTMVNAVNAVNAMNAMDEAAGDDENHLLSDLLEPAAGLV